MYNTPCANFFTDVTSTLTRKKPMTLMEFFSDKARGSKIKMAADLGISKTWLSILISGRKLPSPEMARDIEAYTGGRVKRVDLRPDIFGKTAK